jgi:hypothetical protein
LHLVFLAALADKPVVLQVEGIDTLVPHLDTRCASPVFVAPVAQVVLAIACQFHVGIRQYWCWRSHGLFLPFALVLDCASFSTLGSVTGVTTTRWDGRGDNGEGRDVGLDTGGAINHIGRHNGILSRGLARGTGTGSRQESGGMRNRDQGGSSDRRRPSGTGRASNYRMQQSGKGPEDGVIREAFERRPGLFRGSGLVGFAGFNTGAGDTSTSDKERILGKIGKAYHSHRLHQRSAR